MYIYEFNNDMCIRCHKIVLLVRICDIYSRYIYGCCISEYIVCTGFVRGEIYTSILFLKGYVVMHIYYGYIIACNNLIHSIMSYIAIYIYIYSVQGLIYMDLSKYTFLILYFLILFYGKIIYSMRNSIYIKFACFT